MPTTTAPGESAYFAAGAHFGAERRRLELLEQRYDPVTFERLRAAGVAPGWRCLEVGAGGGSVARWLAEAVGPDGLVVATDIDTRFLGHLRAPVEVRRHDVLTDPIEPRAYDLVHCRSLLMHLPDPAAALARMAQALRPGGWLVAENSDYSSFSAASPDHPRAAGWNRAAAEVMAVVEGHALFAPNLGRRIPQLVAQTGLRIVAHDGRTSVRRGGDPVAHLLVKSFDHVAGLVAFVGVGAELEAVLAGLDDPTFEFVDATNFGVSARHEPPSSTDLHQTAFA
jgi:SAM-dependent methyltransferase